MSKRTLKIGCLLFVGLIVGAGAGGVVWYQRGIEPLPKGDKFFLRFDEPVSQAKALETLNEKSVVRNPQAARLFARINKKPIRFASGTYQFNSGMTLDEVFGALNKPIKQMFRFPETNWARRSANLLERKEITTAKEYMAIVTDASSVKDMLPFPVPPTNHLEGYLFPDTYDLPPLIGAKGVVARQIDAFKKKAMPLLEGRDDIHRVLTVASMVELEVAVDDERPLVAGVIENRIKKGMLLQIDATINYALQKWRPLTFKDLRETDSPYNTYLYKGLPPGPICSPSSKSIQAALNPAQHNYLYYVALPNKRHLFSATYEEHRRNIAKRKAAIAALKK